MPPPRVPPPPPLLSLPDCRAVIRRFAISPFALLMRASSPPCRFRDAAAYADAGADAATMPRQMIFAPFL